MDQPWDRTILGIDQSMTSTGIVVGGNGVVDFMDVIRTKPDKTDDLANYKRCMEIRDRIIDIANKFVVDKVYIEDLSFNAPGSSNRQLAGLLYTIVTSLIEEGYEVETVAPTSLKKSACGKGNGKKEDMMAALPEEIKDVVASFPKGSQDDVTDAYWLCMYESH